MDRSTRIAIVVSVVWVLTLAWAWQEQCGLCSQGFGSFITLCLPVAAYWAYRFIRAGRPSKINQPE